jgi:hypothetical protein
VPRLRIDISLLFAGLKFSFPLLAGQRASALIPISLHFLIIIPLFGIGSSHPQIKAGSKFSDNQRAVSVSEPVAVCVQEANAEPFLAICQAIGLRFNELQQIACERRAIHALICEYRQKTLNDFIGDYPRT